MSAEAATAPTKPALAPEILPPMVLEAARRRAQIFRLAFGMVLSSALAFGLVWPLSFITPVLAAKLLTLPRAMPPKLAVGFLVVFGVCLLFGTKVMLASLAYPAVHVLLTGLVLFLLFYAKAGGTQPVLIVLAVIAILMIPLVGSVNAELAGSVAAGLYIGAVVSIAVVYVAVAAFPDPPGLAPAQGKDADVTADVPPPRARAALALRSLIVLFPLAMAFQMLSLVGGAVALIMAIMLSLEPTFGKHLAAGKSLIFANLAGGLVAVVIYELLVFVPSFTFFLMLVLLAGLVIGKWIFSDSVLGKLLAAGITAVFIILGPSLTGDAAAEASLFIRLLLIVGAVLYVVLAFALLERLTRGRRRLAT